MHKMRRISMLQQRKKIAVKFSQINPHRNSACIVACNIRKSFFFACVINLPKLCITFRNKIKIIHLKVKIRKIVDILFQKILHYLFIIFKEWCNMCINKTSSDLFTSWYLREHIAWEICNDFRFLFCLATFQIYFSPSIYLFILLY